MTQQETSEFVSNLRQAFQALEVGLMAHACRSASLSACSKLQPYYAWVMRDVYLGRIGSANANCCGCGWVCTGRGRRTGACLRPASLW